jgi:hypothetical protein
MFSGCVGCSDTITFHRWEGTRPLSVFGYYYPVYCYSKSERDGTGNHMFHALWLRVRATSTGAHRQSYMLIY